MTPRTDRMARANGHASAVRVRLGGLVAAAILLSPVWGCAKPVVKETEVGRHHVRWLPPPGWEQLDHGRQQLFRRDEAQISLVDLGPATREAMIREIRAARELWRAGRKKDALARVRELRGPELTYASWQQRADFWRPWTDATYAPDRMDEAAVETAFDALVDGVRKFDEPTEDVRLAYVFGLTADRPDREIRARNRRAIHGAEWLDVETWSRVSHQDRSRLAFVDDDGCLLALVIDRGQYETTGPAFEAVLQSIEVVPDSSRSR